MAPSGHFCDQRVCLGAAGYSGAGDPEGDDPGGTVAA